MNQFWKNNYECLTNSQIHLNRVRSFSLTQQISPFKESLQCFVTFFKDGKNVLFDLWNLVARNQQRHQLEMEAKQIYG